MAVQEQLERKIRDHSRQTKVMKALMKKIQEGKLKIEGLQGQVTNLTREKKELEAAVKEIGR